VLLFTVTVAFTVGGGGGGGGGVTMLPPPHAVRAAIAKNAALNASLFMLRILIKPKLDAEGGIPSDCSIEPEFNAVLLTTDH
jgi:hypothetical protein